MTDLPIPPALLSMWRTKYDDWAERRERISAQELAWSEGRGMAPSPNDWEYSDETAVALLHEIAELAGPIIASAP